jgi:hypothetical protein
MPGWKPLIVCNTDCGYGHLVTLVKNLMYDLVLLTTLFAVIGFIYAGFILLTSGGNKGKYDDAKRMLQMVGKGFLWILVAWLLVYTITNALLKDDFNFLLGRPE